jgi:Raf kinase inhibitor-like YbhB/YbcL family protein
MQRALPMVPRWATTATAHCRGRLFRPSPELRPPNFPEKLNSWSGSEGYSDEVCLEVTVPASSFFRFFMIGCFSVVFLAVGCNRGEDGSSAPHGIQLISPEVANGLLNRAATCDGPGSSPKLSWSTPPSGTRSLALVVTDRDAPFGYNFVHWVIYNIPPDARDLPASVPARTELSDGIRQSLNDSGQPGYTPPCPRGHSAHRYDFVLYAVDKELSEPLPSKKKLLEAMRGHVLSEGELIGSYAR